MQAREPHGLGVTSEERKYSSPVIVGSGC